MATQKDLERLAALSCETGDAYLIEFDPNMLTKEQLEEIEMGLASLKKHGPVEDDGYNEVESN